MGELETYSLMDFMPMEPEVYLRLFERLNETVWPFQIIAFAIGIAIIAFIWRGWGRAAGALLGLCWIASGAAFHLDLFAELNWAAVYTGWAFIGQGVILAVVGFTGALNRDVSCRPLTFARCAGLGMALFGLAVYPLLGPTTGRSWQAVEIFGIAPDPTALFTLGILLMRTRMVWIAVPVPLVWCLLSGAVWYAMNWLPGLVVPLAALVVAIFLLGKRLGGAGEH